MAVAPRGPRVVAPRRVVSLAEARPVFDAHSVLRARGFNAAYTFQFGAGTRAPHALAAVRAAAPMLRDFFRTKLPAGLQSAAHVGLGPVIPSKVAEAGAPLGVELQIWLSASALAALGSRLPPSAVALASVPTQLLGQPGDPPLVAGLRSVDVTATEAVVAGLPPSIAGCGDFEAVLAFLRLVYGPQLGPQVLEVLGVTDASLTEPLRCCCCRRRPWVVATDRRPPSKAHAGPWGALRPAALPAAPCGFTQLGGRAVRRRRSQAACCSTAVGAAPARCRLHPGDALVYVWRSGAIRAASPCGRWSPPCRSLACGVVSQCYAGGPLRWRGDSRSLGPDRFWPAGGSGLTTAPWSRG